MRFDRLFGVCVLAMLLAASALAQNEGARSVRAKAELEALRDKISDIRREIAADSSQRSALASALASAEADISAAGQRLRKIDDTIAAHRRRVADLTRRRDRERADLSGQLDALRAQVRAAYRGGRINRMRLLLSGQSPAKLGRMLVYYEYFAKTQTVQVSRLRSALADLAERQRALAEEQARLAAQRKVRADTLARLKANQEQRRQTIAKLDSRLASRKASLSELKSDAQRLEKLMDSLQQQLAELPGHSGGAIPFSRLKGRMKPPVSGQVLASFGSRKAGGPLRWQGEWRAAPTGTPVRAVAGGQVVYVGYMHRYGLIVVVDHGQNYYSLYGHAESIYVEVGDEVVRGQPVATAGRSGGHRRSGVYFEIREGRTAIDPAHWLSG